MSEYILLVIMLCRYIYNYVLGHTYLSKKLLNQSTYLVLVTQQITK
jgi:hypothetical protein